MCFSIWNYAHILAHSALWVYQLCEALLPCSTLLDCLGCSDLSSRNMYGKTVPGEEMESLRPFFF